MIEFLEDHTLHIGLAVIFLTGWVRDYLQRRAIVAGAETVQRASVALLQPYDRRLADLEREVKDLREELRLSKMVTLHYVGGTEALRNQVLAMGKMPCWTAAERYYVSLPRSGGLDYY